MKRLLIAALFLGLFGCKKYQIDEVVYYKRFHDRDFSNPNAIQYERNHFKKINDSLVEWSSFIDSTHIYTIQGIDAQDTTYVDSLEFTALLLAPRLFSSMEFNSSIWTKWRVMVDSLKAKNEDYSLYEFYFEIARRAYEINDKPYHIVAYKYYFTGDDGVSWIYYSPDMGKLAGYNASWSSLTIRKATDHFSRILMERLLADSSFFPYPVELKKRCY